MSIQYSSIKIYVTIIIQIVPCRTKINKLSVPCPPPGCGLSAIHLTMYIDHYTTKVAKKIFVIIHSIMLINYTDTREAPLLVVC